MSTEDELKQWLCRPKKTFVESLRFGIRACKSFEFALQSKYDIFLTWFCDGIGGGATIDLDLISEMVGLSYPPGLVLESTKLRFIDTILAAVETRDDYAVRAPIELLQKLSDQQFLQTYYRTEIAKYCELEGAIFKRYRRYVQSNAEFVATNEHTFFSNCLMSLRNFIQRTTVNSNSRQQFTALALTPLIEAILLMKTKNLQYYDDTFAIIKILYLNEGKFQLADFDALLPCHVFMHLTDYAVNFNREQKTFLNETMNLTKDRKCEPEVALKKTAHVVDLFRKYDVNLDFTMTNQITGFQILADIIQSAIELHQNNHLYDVMTLVCSAIKLNPLIVEKIIFEITTGFLMMPKSDREWPVYVEFLGLLIDMFRKLSRAEKLVLYLLKSIKLYLDAHGLSNSLKRKIAKSDLNSSKKRIKLADGSSEAVEQCATMDEFFLSIVCQEFKTVRSTSDPANNEQWKYIASAWPPDSVGVQFTKFITTLMSKPSLVVWKTLVFSLAECIEQLKNSPPDEKLLALIDFNSALLCQYLAGSRLHEQTDKFWDEINKNRILTRKVLHDFGQTLLDREHNNRTMDAFLEIAYHIGYFDLITWHYSSDSLETDDLQKLPQALHEYLLLDEWISLEQRIVNFGKNHTKINMNRVHLQKMEAIVMFTESLGNKTSNLNVEKSLLSGTLADATLTTAIFCDSTNSWIMEHLSRQEKKNICDVLFIGNHHPIDLEFLSNFRENWEFFELIIFTMYKRMAGCFESKKSILKVMDFEEIFNENKTKSIVQVIKTKSEEYTIKKYSGEELKAVLNVVSVMPIEFCRCAEKATLFALNLALYKDILATHDDELVPLCFELFPRLLHFGEPINIFAHFDIEMLISTFSPSQLPEFYESVFSKFNKLNQSTETCLSKIHELLKAEEPELSENLLKLSIILLQYLSDQHSSKSAKQHQEKIILILAECIKYYFSKENRDKIADKEFVEKTLPVFPNYINHIFDKQKDSDEITEEFRKICKIFIGHSINCKNPHAIKLIAVALTYRSQLHFDPDEIQFVLQQYWNQITTDARTGALQLKNVENALKIVIDYKTNEEFMHVFIDIEKDLQKDNFEYACRMLTQIAGCRLNAYKGALLNEYFKRITFKIILGMERTPDKQFVIDGLLLSVLESQKAICDNKKIPLSVDHMDDILTFMMDINIKNFPVNETNIKMFQNLYQSITGVCLSLIRFRNLIVLDRVPQFVHVFKGLLQAICWYRSERPKDMNLETEEIEELAELAHNVENLMHAMAIHTVEMKRIAPYLLTYTISLMVMNKRSTTLYPKIKTHIENICHELIALCDHRVGSFILRCSNDATKQVYETLCKEYQKYRKFKGKV